jgi:hypothetical protein
VRLAVGTERLAPRLQVRRHFGDIRVEGIEVEDECWSRNVAAQLHPARC